MLEFLGFSKKNEQNNLSIENNIQKEKIKLNQNLSALNKESTRVGGWDKVKKFGDALYGVGTGLGAVAGGVLFILGVATTNPAFLLIGGGQAVSLGIHFWDWIHGIKDED